MTYFETKIPKRYKLIGKPNKHYVYLLRNPLKGDAPFYVGKGTNRRFLDHFNTNKGNNSHKFNTIRKIVSSGLDVVVEIVFSSDNEHACFAKEQELIAEIGRNNLVNLSDGGEGLVGGKHSLEHREKLKTNNPGGKATAKPILQIDQFSGVVIKEWPSSKKAGEGMGLSSKNYAQLAAVASRFKHRTAKGFYWRWLGDDSVIDGILQHVKQLTETRLDLSLRSSVDILQISLDGQTVIATWKNMCVAANTLGINNTSISLAIKQQRPYAGFRWCKTH